MICCICFSEVERTEHLSIYINGSEGADLCHACKLDLTDHLRRIRNVAARAKKSFMLSMKKGE